MVTQCVLATLGPVFEREGLGEVEMEDEKLESEGLGVVEAEGEKLERDGLGILEAEGEKVTNPERLLLEEKKGEKLVL